MIISFGLILSLVEFTRLKVELNSNLKKKKEKALQYCKVISHQLVKINEKKRNLIFLNTHV